MKVLLCDICHYPIDTELDLDRAEYKIKKKTRINGCFRDYRWEKVDVHKSCMKELYKSIAEHKKEEKVK